MLPAATAIMRWHMLLGLLMVGSLVPSAQGAAQMQLPCHPYLAAAVQFTCPYCQGVLQDALSATAPEDCPPQGTPVAACLKDNIDEFFAVIGRESCWAELFVEGGGHACLPAVRTVVELRLWAISEVDTVVHPGVSTKERDCLPPGTPTVPTGSEVGAGNGTGVSSGAKRAAGNLHWLVLLLASALFALNVCQ